MLTYTGWIFRAFLVVFAVLTLPSMAGAQGQIGPFDWREGPWSTCSAACDGGTQTRIVTCRNGAGNVISDAVCLSEVGPKPATSQACNTNSCPLGAWQISDWSQCSAACGGGTQSRHARCVNGNGDPLPDAMCSAPLPALTQACNVQSCGSSLTPRIECVRPDQGSDQLIAVFGYESQLHNGNFGPYIHPPSTANNSVLVNGVDAGPLAGVPAQFLPGLHQNAFSFRFDPKSDVVLWNLRDPLSGTLQKVGPNENTAWCEAPGPQGPQGLPGVQGPIGPKGTEGPMGPVGPQGADGKHGPQGVAGVAGPQGIDGRPGPEGAPGMAGPQGLDGRPGPQGVAGPAGPAGAMGPRGDAGPMGITGPQGPGLKFTTVKVTREGGLVLPAGSTSVLFLAATQNNLGRPRGYALTLPPPAIATSRFITVRKVDARGTIEVQSRPGDSIDDERATQGGGVDTIELKDRWSSVTLVSDGVSWFVFAYEP